MKVYIQSNKYQSISAKVAKYSFERFGYEVEIMSLEKNHILLDKINNQIKRNNKIVKYKDDLQSFTLLRFYAPFLCKTKNNILVIDPDIFALKDPKELFSEIQNEEFDIACTFYNNNPRSEMMLINTNNVKWDFNKIIEKLFNFEIDYKDLMNLNFDKNLKIKKISNKYNSHDKINYDTVLLHTTNRITQPWKEGLNINFERNNISYFNLIKQLIKKILNFNYDKNLLTNKFQKHPDEGVRDIVKKLFIEAKNKKIISEKEINNEINNNNLSKNIFT